MKTEDTSLSISAKSQSLFRAEVIQAREAAWLGGIRIGRNPCFSAVAANSILLAGALISFAVWGQVTRKARIPGVLMPEQGMLQLSVTAAGVIQEQLVQEGEHVRSGQTLFVLSTDRNTTGGLAAALLNTHFAQRQNTLEIEHSARIKQAQQRGAALLDRMHALDFEIEKAQQEVTLSQRRAELAQKTLGRYQQLAQEDFVADIQVQNKQEEWIDLQARVESAQRNTASLFREKQSLQAELQANQSQLSIDLTQIDRAKANLAQESTENQSRQTLVITAPQSGTVSEIHLHPGTVMQASQSVGSLVPDVAETESGQPFSLQAHLYAPSKTAGFVKPGQSVWMRYSAFPYQKFGLALGRVLNVGASPIAPQDLPNGHGIALQSATQSQEALYRIQVQLEKQNVTAYGEQLPLRPGMTLEADVVQDTRAVWEWVFEPLLAARQKVKVL